MIPLILAPLLAKLAESGLSLIGNAVLNKGKDFVEEKLGVSLEDSVATEQGKQALLQLQTDHEEALIAAAIENRKVDLDFYKADAADRSSARDMNTAINESAYSSWLSKNIVPMIALIVVVGGGLLIGFSPEADVRLGVTSIVTLVLGFYFGTSASSKIKDVTIASMAQTTGEPK
jgi:hypothetical protein